MKSPEKSPQFNVIDTSLRDLLQSPVLPEHGKYSVTTSERREIFKALVEYGVRYVEVFSPLVNNTEKESLTEILKLRDELASQYGYVFILAHVRCDERDVSAAIDAGVDGLNMYMGTSQESRQSNHGKKLKEISVRARTLLENTRQSHPDIQLRFSGEDAFRTPIRDLYSVYDYIAGSVDRFGTPDTVGIATPDRVKKRVTLLKKRYPRVALEGHFHNDRGFALINAVSAVFAGMEFIDTSVLGLAERSGITSITGLLFNLYLDKPDLVAHFQTKDSYTLNVLVANIMRMQVPFTEPVSLTNATHSAGVHTSAMLKNSNTYQALPLKDFGVDDTRLLLGPLSGWHVVSYYLLHFLNFEGVSDDVAKEITHIFKEKCPTIKDGEKPMDLLRQIAQEYHLTQRIKPVTHTEKL